MTGFPLLIGIVGQDVLADGDLPNVSMAVRSVVEDLRASYPHTEIVVFSSPDSRASQEAVEAAQSAGAEILTSAGATSWDERIAIAHLVLLVWDGRSSAPTCAKAAQVREGHFRGPNWRPLENPDIGPYYVIDPAGAIAKQYPPRYSGDNDGERDFHSALRALDRYNSDLFSSTAPLDETLEQIRTQTDAIANRLQRAKVASQCALYALAMLAAIVEIVGSESQWLIKLAVILAALVVYSIARRRDVQNRYQDYRAVAEALRVQNAWWCAAVEDPVHRAYLRMQQSELQWIRMVLRVAALLHRPPEIRLEPESLLRWIEEQRVYFLAAGNRAARSERFFHSLVRILVIADIVISLGAGVFVSIWSVYTHTKAALPLKVGELVACVAVLIGLLDSYSRARSFGENAKRYRRMFLLFEEAQSELDAVLRPQDTSAIQRLVRSLGQEALTEQAEWLLSQRDRPVSIIHGAG